MEYSFHGRKLSWWGFAGIIITINVIIMMMIVIITTNVISIMIKTADEAKSRGAG